MKRITIEDKFFENKEAPEDCKLFILKMLYEFDDGEFHKSYLDTWFGVNPPAFFKDEFIFSYNNDDVVTINMPMLKKRFGLSVRVLETKKIEVDLEKINKVFTAYNEVRNLFYYKKGNPHMPMMQLTKARYKNLMLIANFLELNKVEDWHLYFYCLFEASHWAFCWCLNRCATPEAYDLYTNLKAKCANEIEITRKNYEDAKTKRFKEAKGEATSRWFSLFDFVEKQKEIYANRDQAEICMNNSDLTLGYHPLSKICVACPLKPQCALSLTELFQNITRTNLDIIKVRGKLITIEEARKWLKNANSSFDFYN